MNKRFVILEQLGQGGHGKVYRARDEQLDRVVAIKVFHDAHPEGERLMKEARTLCQLKHPGIINVYDVGRVFISEGPQTTITLSEDGGAQPEKLVWAMIMEDLGDLDPFQYVEESGADEALRIVADIAEALQTAHERGIFHCDLNNNNVRIVGNRAVVFDFSLAARQPGRPYGTPACRAPEQTRGDEPTDRTDVYGLGRLLLGLLRHEAMGKLPAARPFLPRDSGLANRSRKDIEALLHSMLDPEPQKRPAMEKVARVCRRSVRPRSTWRSTVLRAAGALLLLVAVLEVIGFGKTLSLSQEQRAGSTAAGTFTVLLRVHGAANDSALIQSAAGAKVMLDLGSDRRVALFDSNGEATVREVPSRFHGQLVPVLAQVPGYTMLEGKTHLLLSSDPVYVELSRDDAPIPARLRISLGLVHQGKNILMVRRRQKEGKLSWQFPAGIVKPLQEPDQRIIEEVLKETGVSVKIVSKFGERISPDTKAHMIYFECEYLVGELRNGEPDENAEVAWVPAGKVETYVTSNLWDGVLNKLNGLKHADAR